jgi:hypothetical protein
MRYVWMTAALFAIICVMNALPGKATVQDPQSGSLRIGNDDLGSEDPAILVSVTKAGSIVKSSDCTAARGISWEKIAEGDYEVRFEAPNKQKLLKRIHITAGEETVLSAKLPDGKGITALGAGPSISDLDVRLKKLEIAVAGMKRK